MTENLRLAALLPAADLAGRPDEISEWARGVEALGFDEIVVHDHVLGGPHEERRLPMMGPYTEADAFDEAMVMLGYLAAVTTRIGLRTNIVVAPQRQTALLAKQAAQIDLLSKERLTLGVGVGWNHVEYDALDVDFGTRGARLSEQLDVMRLLWTEPLVTFTGHHHELDRCGLNPRPRRTIPIWIGGASEAAVVRAARSADGFSFGMPGSFTNALVDRLHVALSDAGRDPAAFGLDVMADHSRGIDTIVRVASRWAEVGGTSITVNTGAAIGSGSAGDRERRDVGHHIDALAETAAALRHSADTVRSASRA